MLKNVCLRVAALLAALVPSVLSAQTSAFTYQGRLNDNGTAVTGIYDLRFALYDSLVNGNAVAIAQTNSAVAVTNGLFTVILDFGANIFDGSARWLDIGVRPNGNGAFTPLTPRQQLSSAPYAIQAGNATTASIAATASTANSVAAGSINLSALALNVLNATNLTGTLPEARLSDNVPRLKLANTTAAFALVQSLGIGASPSFVMSADVNGDSKADLISANSGLSTLSVFTNRGTGLFTLAQSCAVGSSPRSVAAADVNGDGKIDLVSANLSANTLSVLTNNGNGLFSVAQSPAVGANPNSVTAADVNGDGRMDLISANYAGGTLSVLTNNGSGFFTLAQSAAAGVNPGFVTAADVNGDGKVDLINTLALGEALSVQTNNGNGVFSLAQSPTVGIYPNAVAAVDVNGDGKVDLISADAGGLTLSTNNGNGTFTLAQFVGSAAQQGVAAADVNGDGKVDLISADTFNDLLSVFTNNGTGYFIAAPSPAVGDYPVSVVAVDVNGDSNVDLISANQSANTLSILAGTPSPQIFSAPTVFTSSANSFVGNGAGLNNLNADNLTSGTVADARLSATVSRLGQTIESAEITSVDASKVTSGSLDDARLSSNVALRNAGQTFTGQNIFNHSGNAFTGTFSGNGGSVTNLNASNLASGTVADARLSTNVPRLNAQQTFTGTNIFSSPIGVGTNNPGANLHVVSTSQVATVIDSSNTSGTDLVLGNSSVSSIGRYWHILAGGSQTAGGAGSNVLHIAAGTTLNSIASRVYIKPTGSVGIGKYPGNSSLLDVAGRGSFDGGINIGQTFDATFSVSPSSAGSTYSTAIFANFLIGNSLSHIHYGDNGDWYIRSASTAGKVILQDQGGNVGIGLADPVHKLHVAGNIYATGAIVQFSDRNAKTDIEDISPVSVLEKVASLPISQWRYKSEKEGIKHVGPMAQDFHEAFGLGFNDTSITTIDESGVALAAIQGLNQKLTEELKRRDVENAELKARLEKLEQLLQNKPE